MTYEEAKALAKAMAKKAFKDTYPKPRLAGWVTVGGHTFRCADLVN